MAHSKIIIESEKKKRKLSDREIVSFISYKITNDERCSRCQSQNFQPIIDTRLTSGSYSAYEVEYHSKKCRICGYNPFKDKSLNFKIRLNKWLGRYYRKKLK